MLGPVDYGSPSAPTGYYCKSCGLGGVAMYRQYQCVADCAELLCRKCALANQSMKAPDGRHSIGWLVAAVPTQDGLTFWGYTSVPDAGVEWWDRLPKATTVRPKQLSRRRGTPWYRHRDAWAKSYRHDFGSMRMAMLARYWFSCMRDCEDIAKKYATRNNECST